MKREKSKPLRQIIYNQLVNDIMHGKFNAGEKLLESELSRRFQVSRTPIREVFLQLERERYITLTKNVGAIVKKISMIEVKEIFSLIAQLDGYATELVAGKKISEEDISLLMSLQQEMEHSVDPKQHLKYLKLNLEFHKFFVNRCGNETLQEISEDLRQKIHKYIVQGSTLPTSINTYLSSHRDIIEAVRSRDSLKAGNLMKTHIMDAFKFHTEIMKKKERYQI